MCKVNFLQNTASFLHATTAGKLFACHARIVSCASIKMTSLDTGTLSYHVFLESTCVLNDPSFRLTTKNVLRSLAVTSVLVYILATCLYVASDACSVFSEFEMDHIESLPFSEYLVFHPF